MVILSNVSVFRENIFNRWLGGYWPHSLAFRLRVTWWHVVTYIFFINILIGLVRFLICFQILEIWIILLHILFKHGTISDNRIHLLLLSLIYHFDLHIFLTFTLNTVWLICFWLQYSIKLSIFNLINSFEYLFLGLLCFSL